MSNDPAPRRRIRRVEEGTGFHSQVDWMLAVLLLGAAAASVLYFHVPLVPPVFEPDAPDFNPVVVVTVFLSVFGLKYVISAVRATMRSRRFGQSVLEMEGETVAPGETLKGVVRVPAGLAPLGDYEILLQCVQQARPTSISDRLQDYIRGEQALRVDAKTVNPREGIPFAFTIPTDAMTTALPDVRAEGSVHWILEVKAPLKGLDFYAIFGVEVRARRQLQADRAAERASPALEPETKPSALAPLSLDLFDARLRKLGAAKLGLERALLVPADGIATMLEFYRADRAEGYAGPGQDKLLFQWGAYEGEDGEHFELDITRQFSLDPGGDDADLWQLGLTFLYIPAPHLRALGEGSEPCWAVDDIPRFEKFIRRSPAMRIVGGTAAKTVSLRYVSL